MARPAALRIVVAITVATWSPGWCCCSTLACGPLPAGHGADHRDDAQRHDDEVPPAGAPDVACAGHGRAAEEPCRPSSTGQRDGEPVPCDCGAHNRSFAVAWDAAPVVLVPQIGLSLLEARQATIEIPAADEDRRPVIHRGQPPPNDSNTLLARHCMLTV